MSNRLGILVSQKHKDLAISILLAFFAIIWILPIVWSMWISFRPYPEVFLNGLVSIPKKLTLDNYREALQKMSVVKYFINTLIILIPSVFFILLFGSFIAFVISKYKIKHGKTMLLFFTAGSLLPAQFISYPIFKMYIYVGAFFGDKTLLYDNYIGVILVHIAVQTGFAVFVIYFQLQKIPREFSEAAVMDGASVFKHYLLVIVPMLKSSLSALGLMLTVWIYNDFYWAWSLIKRDQFFPITTSLSRVGALSRVIPDPAVLAAGCILVALPLFVLVLIYRKYFNFGAILGQASKSISLQ